MSIYEHVRRNQNQETNDMSGGDTDNQPETDEPKIDETPTEQPASTDETHETGGTSDPVGE